jgi:V8-like Glu-specific endopeptidase
MILSKPAMPGMSGSPIYSKTGHLVGILTKGNNFASIAMNRMAIPATYGPDYFYEKQSIFTPYICEKQ